VMLTNLTPGKTYHYRVTAKDTSGNTGNSGADLTFKTRTNTVAPTPTPFSGGDMSIIWAILAAVAFLSVAAAAILLMRRRPQASGPMAQTMRYNVPPQSEEIPQTDYDLDTEAARDARTDGAVETLDMEQGAPEVLEMEDMAQPEFGRVGTVPPHIAASVQTPQEHAAQYQVPIAAVAASQAQRRPASISGTAASLAAAVGAAPEPGPRHPAPGARPPAPAPLRHIRCPRCKTRIPIYKEGAQEVTCSACGKKGPYAPKGVGTLANANLPVPPPEQAQSYDAPQIVEAPEEVYAPTFAPTYSAPQPSRTQARTPVRLTRCSNCGSQVPIYTTVYPVRISCPSCGRSGMYKGPRTQ